MARSGPKTRDGCGRCQARRCWPGRTGGGTESCDMASPPETPPSYQTPMRDSGALCRYRPMKEGEPTMYHRLEGRPAHHLGRGSPAGPPEAVRYAPLGAELLLGSERPHAGWVAAARRAGSHEAASMTSPARQPRPRTPPRPSAALPPAAPARRWPPPPARQHPHAAASDGHDAALPQQQRPHLSPTWHQAPSAPRPPASAGPPETPSGRTARAR